MKVILLDEVRNLGEPGAVVEVADGYARNFLLPRKLAVAASSGAVKSLAHHKRVAARRLASMAKSAQGVAQQLGEIRVELKAKAGEAGKMYGSVTAGQIADELERAHGLQVDKRKIHLEEPIKVLGEHVVQIGLHRDVRAEITVEVVAEEPEEEAAPAQEAPEAAQAEPEAAQSAEASAETPPEVAESAEEPAGTQAEAGESAREPAQEEPEAAQSAQAPAGTQPEAAESAEEPAGTQPEAGEAARESEGGPTAV